MLTNFQPVEILTNVADMNEFKGLIAARVRKFLPRDATQSAVMPQYIVCLSVRPSVRL